MKRNKVSLIRKIIISISAFIAMGFFKATSALAISNSPSSTISYATPEFFKCHGNSFCLFLYRYTIIIIFAAIVIFLVIIFFVVRQIRKRKERAIEQGNNHNDSINNPPMQ